MTTILDTEPEPEWLLRLSNLVTDKVDANFAPIVRSYGRPADEEFECATVLVMPIRFVAPDGEVDEDNIRSVDVSAVAALLGASCEVSYSDDEDALGLHFEGSFEGHSVVVSVSFKPIDDAPPDFRMHSDGTFHELQGAERRPEWRSN